MKQFFTVVFVSLFVTQQVFAVPAYPNPVNVTLPDGSEITIQLRGDEWINWAETLDGFTLLRNSEGFFEYATLNDVGDLIPSGIRANYSHDMSQRTSGEREFLQDIPKGLMFSDDQIEMKLQLRGVADDFLKQGPRRVSGTVRIPVVLVGFTDRPFTRSKEDFQMLFNQLNYTVGGVFGSVRDYFLAVSYEQLDIQADIFGPFSLPGPIRNFTNNSGCGGDSRNMARMAIDSAHAVGANFAIYAVNGVVPAVHIVFAGFGTEVGAPACQSIWSHAWSFPPRILNGVSLSRFSTSPELRGISGTDLGTIGVIVHELGHSILGWPDSYSVRRGPGTGGCVDLGHWCVMASGAHSGAPSGSRPPRPSAWFVVDAGWVPEITLTLPDSITMPNPTQAGVVYRINTNTPNEYFLLENRQRVDWDLHIPSSGMLIYHVDRTPGALPFWANNEIQTRCNRRRLYIKQAGCAAQNGCNWARENDAWPRGNFNAFTDNSTPNARSWAGARTNKPVTNITHNSAARTISFEFMGGSMPTVPYFEGFESITVTQLYQPLPAGWVQHTQSAGDDGDIWHTSLTVIMSDIGATGPNLPPRTGQNQMVRIWQDAGHFAWVFSPPIQLYAETTYTVNFWYRAPGGGTRDPDNFKVQIGPSKEIIGTGASANMSSSITILTVNDQQVPNWTQVVVEYTPTTTGAHYLGFHCMTPNRGGRIITIDDISITVLATHIPVTDITNVPTTATVGTPFALTGTVVPSNATNQTIVWSIQDAGTTGGTIDGHTINTTSVGTLTVRATIVNGATETTDFTRDFNIIVSELTSIIDLEKHNVLNVFPNPFTDEIHIVNAEIGSMLYVLNTAGLVVHSQRITRSTETIHLGRLPADAYILRIGKQTIRVVKQ